MYHFMFGLRGASAVAAAPSAAAALRLTSPCFVYFVFFFVLHNGVFLLGQHSS